MRQDVCPDDPPTLCWGVEGGGSRGRVQMTSPQAGEGAEEGAEEEQKWMVRWPRVCFALA